MAVFLGCIVIVALGVFVIWGCLKGASDADDRKELLDET